MQDVWAFGWTQVLTLTGFAITIVIAVSGFQSFGRWRRQQIEERRIDIAFEALSIAHESKFVFSRIRAPNGFEAEWRSMPIKPGESEQDKNAIAIAAMIVFVCIYLIWTAIGPSLRSQSNNMGFDKSWDCPPNTGASTVCVKKKPAGN
jgi:hypothetical protein